MKLNTHLFAGMLITGMLLTATTPAFAAKDLGFYLGGQVNSTSIEDNIGKFDESAIGLGVYGGYNFNDSFGLETSIFATDSFVDEGDFRMAAMSISPVVRHAFTDSVTVYLKAGLVINTTYSDDDDNDESYKGTGWLFGAGVDVTLTESLALRVFYEINETEPESGELDKYYADISLVQYGLGLHYRF
ncbi:porin family protein [Shewanella eurypsychrophilus]|uniref:Porin family protein n=1 Tax=Shewanella eurypsychrophilus TaxID=2593656 RepID=A0ABX6VEJ5_9GAMM|nr:MULTISPECIES: porin family protein [Shewanella]QFU25021.1 outer membrane beta-barrel protein [Shewanella sp. YLB-09]QPG60197.1 porin family protein [Shewanella eurypsychrophilus]